MERIVTSASLIARKHHVPELVIGLPIARPRDDVSLFYLNRLEGRIRRASPAQARTYLEEERFEGLVVLPDDGKPSRGGSLVQRAAGCLFIAKTR